MNDYGLPCEHLFGVGVATGHAVHYLCISATAACIIQKQALRLLAQLVVVDGSAASAQQRRRDLYGG